MSTTTTAPTMPSKVVRVFAWLSLITETLIVATGGAVRLTESGLGCTTWPTCTGASLISTPELGIHGMIEFGNRTVTGLVSIAAVGAAVALWKYRSARPGLFGLSIALIFAVLLQAFVGGITVLTGLNPLVVGFHYVASLIMVVLAAILTYRCYQPAGRPRFTAPGWYKQLLIVMLAMLGITVIIGVLTTASGPHSGDAEALASRTGYDASLFAHLHAWPGYIALALVVVVVYATLALKLRGRAWSPWLLALIAVQILLGVIQANTGLPPLIVGAHMVIACAVCSLGAILVLTELEPHSSRRPAKN